MIVRFLLFVSYIYRKISECICSVYVYNNNNDNNGLEKSPFSRKFNLTISIRKTAIFPDCVSRETEKHRLSISPGNRLNALKIVLGAVI